MSLLTRVWVLYVLACVCVRVSARVCVCVCAHTARVLRPMLSVSPLTGWSRHWALFTFTHTHTHTHWYMCTRTHTYAQARAHAHKQTNTHCCTCDGTSNKIHTNICPCIYINMTIMKQSNNLSASPLSCPKPYALLCWTTTQMESLREWDVELARRPFHASHF